MTRIALTLVSLTMALGALAADVTCAVDDLAMNFTGNTRTIEGRMFYEYRCPKGHSRWVRQ